MSISGSPQKGHDSRILVGLQDEQRTTVTPTRHLGKIEEETEHPDPEVSWNEEFLIGTGREMNAKTEGQKVYEGGSYPVIAYDGYPLAVLLGSETFTADTPSAGTNEHVLTAAGASAGSATPVPPSLTVEATHLGRGGASDFVRTFNTVVPTSGEISLDNEGRLTTTLDTIAIGVQRGSSPTSDPGMPDRNPWLFSDLSSGFTFDGTTVARLEEFTISINQNSSARHYIESTRAPDPYEILYGGQVGYEFTATVTVVDSTFYDELQNPTAGGVDASMKFSKANGDAVEFSLTGNNLTDAGHATPRGEGAEDDTLQVEMNIVPESLTVTFEDSSSTQGYLA
jgi:hypothetical protein